MTAVFVSKPPVVRTRLIVKPPVSLQTVGGGSGLWNGHGAPGVIIGAAPGDTYLDLDTGALYELN